MKKFSIIQEDMNRCFICDKPNTHKHEIFFGKNHKNSIKYGLVVGLCLEHHTGRNGIHTAKGTILNKRLQEIGQNAFEKVYKDLVFINIF